MPNGTFSTNIHVRRQDKHKTEQWNNTIN